MVPAHFLPSLCDVSVGVDAIDYGARGFAGNNGDELRIFVARPCLLCRNLRRNAGRRSSDKLSRIQTPVRPAHLIDILRKELSSAAFCGGPALHPLLNTVDIGDDSRFPWSDLQIYGLQRRQ